MDVELVGAGQAAQLVALSILVDANAASAAQLALQVDLTVSACDQIVDLFFGEAPWVFLVFIFIEKEKVCQP